MDCQFRIRFFYCWRRIWYRGSRCGLSGCTGRGIVFCLTGTVESADHSQHRLAESRGKYFSVCGSGNRGRFERTAAGIAGGRTGQRWHECCRSLYGKPGAAGICTYGDFSQAHQASLGGLASQCILTEVICSGEAAGYDQQDGIAILGGTPENLPETLSYLEI